LPAAFVFLRKQSAFHLNFTSRPIEDKDDWVRATYTAVIQERLNMETDAAFRAQRKTVLSPVFVFCASAFAPPTGSLQSKPFPANLATSRNDFREILIVRMLTRTSSAGSTFLVAMTRGSR
jgi:hypothetical protein